MQGSEAEGSRQTDVASERLHEAREADEDEEGGSEEGKVVTEEAQLIVPVVPHATGNPPRSETGPPLLRLIVR